MNEQPKFRGEYVYGRTPIDVPRGIAAESDICPRGLNEAPTRYRAQSILIDLVGAGLIHDALLPIEQARDVILWHEGNLARQGPIARDRRRRWLRLIRPKAAIAGLTVVVSRV